MHRLFVLALLACGATAAAPKPPRPVATSNPCFPGNPPIVANEMWKTLEKYSWSVYASEGEQPPPPTTYGSCKVERNQVTTASGTLVAELGCGVRVLVPGIRDHLGIEIGKAIGKDVLERAPATSSKLTCYPNGPDQARCHFERSEGTDTDPDAYVVAGKLDADVLAGDAARTFFATRPIVELGVSIWCH
jgi:hypothetical protein